MYLLWGQSRAPPTADDSQRLDRDSSENNQIWNTMLDTIALNCPSGVRSCYKSLDSASMVLRLARLFEEKLKVESSDFFYEELKRLQMFDFSTGFRNKKVVVIEGLSGSGKSKLIEMLGSMSKKATIISPMRFLLDIRAVFE